MKLYKVEVRLGYSFSAFDPKRTIVNLENFLPTKALVRMSAIMSSVPVCTSFMSPLATFSYTAKYFRLINFDLPRKLMDSSEERVMALLLS